MNLNQKVSLVHIGLVKTATTTMQNIWLKDPRFCLVYGGLLQVIQKARVTGRNAPAGAAIPLKWQYDTRPESGQHIVFSQEALSTAYINERASKKDIKNFQQSAAKITGMIAPGAKILITVREPETWIKSVYNQAIKQGGTDKFPEFLKLEKEFIKQSLNIVDLVNIWGDLFGKENILILPVELMWEDNLRFYEIISRFSGLPVPDLSIGVSTNPSLKEKHLRLMRRFNEWVDLFTRHGVYQQNLPQQVSQALMTIRFAVRYSLESPSPELEKQIADVEKNLPDCEVDLSKIDPDFLANLKSFYNHLIDQEAFRGFEALYSA